jgi:hypothetical protein
MRTVAALLLLTLSPTPASVEDGSGATTPTTIRQAVVRSGCPAGLVFDPPGERVEIRLVLPDGSLTDPIIRFIEPPNSREAKTATLLPPEFRSVTPGSVKRGTAATSIHVTGERLRNVQTVSVLIGSRAWLSLPATNRTDTSLTVRLPARLLAKARFLAIAPTDDEEDAIAFLVADPALPKPGTTTALVIGSISTVDIGPGGALRIDGSGFGDDAIALLGRDGSIALPTEVMSDTRLFAELPESFVGVANDLFIAVATPDRRAASASVAVVATTPFNRPDYRSFIKDPATMTNVLGTLVWKDGNQDLLVDGLGLAAGMEFELTSQGKPRHVRKVATHWDGAPSKDPQLSRVKITMALDELWPTTGCVSPSRR